MFIPVENGPPFYKANSFSGNEQNHLFLNDGKQFHNVTLVSGVDQKTDGRSFAYFDYDHDGWQDIVLVSTNFPHFQIFRNCLGKASSNQRMQIRLQGSASESVPSSNRSNRDGIGAKVLVEFKSGRKLLKHHQVGEGNVAQNSALVWVGFEKSDPVESLTVFWPSGKKTELKVFDASKLIVVEE